MTLEMNPAHGCRRISVVAWTLALLAGIEGPQARAFSDPTLYGDDAANGGGGGRWFTSSLADGYGCAVCHTGRGSLPLTVTGLPADGYVPDTTYTIRIAWPDASARAEQGRQLGLRPSASLVAEFVAEDGTNSGTLAVEPEFARETELCTRTPAEPAVLAATLFSARSIGEPSETTTCDAREKGTRCVVTVRSCGSSELRVVWTAPSRWRDAIWFSAGFVATDNASGVPNDFDFVTELVVPIQAASEDATYQTPLEGGCAVGSAPAPGSSRTGSWLLGVLFAWAWRRRRRVPGAPTRHAARLAVVAFALSAALFVPSCHVQRVGPVDEEDIGLFTPGHDPGRSSSSSDTPDAAAEGGSASPGITCSGTNIPPSDDSDGGTIDAAGTLRVDFVSSLPHGEYDKSPDVFNNIGVVWIEDEFGRYVKALEFWGKRYLLSLKTYLLNRRFGCAVDVVATATLLTHAPHMLVWDGTDLTGRVVPDGNYNLWVEIQIDERQPQAAVSFAFVKGRTAWQNMFPPTTPLQTLTLSYMPMP